MFNNFWLTLGTHFTFYAKVAKELKLKVIKLWRLILTFVKIRGEKLAGGLCQVELITR